MNIKPTRHFSEEPRAYAVLLEIIAHVKAGTTLDNAWLASFIRHANEGVQDVSAHVKKKQLMPVFLAHAGEFDLSQEQEKTLRTLLQAKPRRSASGVATITVLTKPWPCAGSCAFCPNDLRMPKSYLANEPACQRAEQNYFDPYLQVHSRLAMLHSMGHAIDKIELIVLGGTFSDYEASYQRWFVAGLFEALNDGVTSASEKHAASLLATYAAATGPNPDARNQLQARVNAGELSYNEAVVQLGSYAKLERAVSEDSLLAAQRANETADCRCVGLSFETRPNAVTRDELTCLRALGATKIQIGVQSTSDGLLALSNRDSSQAHILRAFKLLRLFGFKIQAHFMLNLPGRTLEEELEDYKTFVTHPAYLPDEIKLYPTSLIGGTELERAWLQDNYTPYSTEELTEALVEDLLITPCYVRVSRVIRDFSATDILAGNKLGNLRQMVEAAVITRGKQLQEIRSREVALAHANVHEATLSPFIYQTSVSEEQFLQVVDNAGRLHGFLRLSLPYGMNHAMIRELHMYGRVARLGVAGEASQHQGLGTALIEEACRISREHGRETLYVISAVGTREYYRGRGFEDVGLYQVRAL